jgi:hypothetical protein
MSLNSGGISEDIKDWNGGEISEDDFLKRIGIGSNELDLIVDQISYINNSLN